MDEVERNNYFNEDSPDRDLIMDWLNTSSVSSNPKERVDIVRKLQEVLIRKTPYLLPEFLSHVLNFVTDKNVDVKKALMGFIEEVCKFNEQYLVNVMLTVHMLLCDENVAVQKRVIQGAITIYRKMLVWLCKATTITEKMEQTWNQLNIVKVEIAKLIDSDNDGVRTSAVKFLEWVVLLQSYPDPSETNQGFSLDDVPLTLKILRRRKLEEEAHNIFELLLKFTGSQHISSANLFACLGAITNIGKNRPAFIPKVINAIELLHSNLPPTLSSTQVNSIRKKLKSELMGLMKTTSCFDFMENISTMLTELGVSNVDIQKLVPKIDEQVRREKRRIQQEYLQNSKRMRMESDGLTSTEINEKMKREASDVNETFVSDNINTEKIIELVLLTLVKVPDSVPSTFDKEYAEFMKGGQVGQYTALVAMLGDYLLKNNLGPGADIIKNLPTVEIVTEENKNDKMEVEEVEKEKKKERLKVPRVKILKLSEITKPLEKHSRDNLMLNAVQRVLTSEKTKANSLKQKVLVTMGTSFTQSVWETILSFLLSDLRTHLDLGLSWLYEEYSIMQGFSRLPPLRRGSRPEQGYNNLIKAFVTSSMTDALVLSRIFLEAPLITDDILEILCSVCRDSSTNCAWASGLLHDLVLRRPPKQEAFLKALLSLTTHDSGAVREISTKHVLDLYVNSKLRQPIEDFAKIHLDYLISSQPSEKLFGESQGRTVKLETWNEDLVRACLMPYMKILPYNPKLIHGLTKVYVQTSADVKRAILRQLEGPVRDMGMESQELLKVIEECPKGSETLVTRVIHILTDKGAPSAQLVQIVRNLCQTKVSDVRFLIPVLNGLTKQEIIAALPKLIKLNPVVVREVFNRLLGLHGDSPISPTELLVALHLIHSSKADLKTVMKATSLCLNEKQVFTQEVLAVVLQQLMEQTPLPTLLMRTVIQALGSYPRLSGFVMNILQRLILKQVWKQKVVWEGFVKCCQRTKPQSFSVLLQLPSLQLSEALKMCPELREPLQQHLNTFTESQRAHIPAAVQEVVFGVSLQQQQFPSDPLTPRTDPSPASTLTTPISTTDKNLKSKTVQNEPLPPGME